MQGTLLLALGLTAMGTESTLVASPNAEVSSLTRKEARQVFTLRRSSWGNGLAVRIVLPPKDSAQETWLSKSVLGLPPDVYQRFLAEQAYRRGGSVPPRADAAGVVAAIAEAGTGAGVISVVSSPVDPSLVAVELRLK